MGKTPRTNKARTFVYQNIQISKFSPISMIYRFELANKTFHYNDFEASPVFQ